jgi:predicted DNA-binding transcriptional regulator AlpA
MNDLLTLDDIAQMHRCSLRHARDVIVKLPQFPPEAPTSTPRNRLWLRSEVRAFIHRKPARIPHTGLQPA